jgi:meiotic recombination protein REC8
LIVNDGDEEFDPKTQQLNIKGVKVSAVGVARKDDHTLREPHGHDSFISSSLEEAFKSANGVELSSSQFEGRFHFEDNFLGMSDGYDLAEGLADELARELGWAVGETPHPVT